MKYQWLLGCAATAMMVAPVEAQTQSSATPPVAPPTGTAASDGTQAPVSTESATGRANQAAAPSKATEIIVTANKRSQAINSVGLTIQAADAATLADRGVGSPADLGKLVPGFTYTESIYSTPVYTLRGIGLYDATFGASPAVAIYTDQIPRNVPVMSGALDLDIERVEVLKGPQGTLFGQSSTGGAINYILGKPTRTAKFGFDAGIERFGKFSIGGFASGPITSSLGVRVAARLIQGGAWQYSNSRPSDKNGKARVGEGRATIDFHPVSALKMELMGTYVRDHSDVQAPQYLGTSLNTYSSASFAAANANPATRNPFGVVNDALYAGLTSPGSPNFDASFLGRQAVVVGRLNGGDPRFAPGARAILGTPIRTDSNRIAEWTPGFLQPSHNSYYQMSLRNDLSLSAGLTLTSMTAVAKQKLRYNQDLDATTARGVDVPLYGNVRSFNQELRLAGENGKLNWLIGGTYDNLRTEQTNFFILNDYTGNTPLGFPGPVIELTKNDYSSHLKSYAGFANAELKLTPALTINGGIRYTSNRQKASYCYNDPAGGDVATVFSIFEGLFGNPGLPPIKAGECFPLGDGLQGTTFGKSTRTPVNRTLNEHNFSYRLGASYKFDGGTLLYATLSQGYKAGIFSAIGASSTSQYAAAKQEKVISYEAGFKTPIAGNLLHLNGAAFYYDYSNKQVRGRVSDPVYGLLEKLVNVPKSSVYGLEADLLFRPVPGFTFSASGTYLKSKVKGSFTQTADGSAVYNAAGYKGNFGGSTLPFTPKFSANADMQYEWQMSGVKPFIGGNLLYQGKENATFANAALPATDFEIPAYTTFDARAGFEGDSGRYKLTAFVRNLTNKNYTTSITTYLDTRFRFTGRPRTYGLTFAYRY